MPSFLDDIDRFTGGLLNSPTFQLGAGLLGAPRGATFGQGLLEAQRSAFQQQLDLGERRSRDRESLSREKARRSQAITDAINAQLRQRELEEARIPTAQAAIKRAETQADKFIQERQELEDIRKAFAGVEVPENSPARGFLTAVQTTGRGLPQLATMMGEDKINTIQEYLVRSPEIMRQIRQDAQRQGIPEYIYFATVARQLSGLPTFFGEAVQDPTTLRAIELHRQRQPGAAAPAPSTPALQPPPEGLTPDETSAYQQMQSALQTSGPSSPEYHQALGVYLEMIQGDEKKTTALGEFLRKMGLIK